MANAHVVHVPFARKHPVTGKMIEYKKGDIIADPNILDDVRGSDHAPHGRAVHLPDEHPAIFPHLPDDHPLKAAAHPAPAPATVPVEKAPDATAKKE